MFNQEDTFGEDDEDGDWWSKPDLSKDKKMERFRASEREVKFQTDSRSLLSNPILILVVLLST